MYKKSLLLLFLCFAVITEIIAQTTICTNKTFATALLFDPASIAGCTNATSCGGSLQIFDNRPSSICAETEPLETCAPTPACATQPAGYDLWFKFYAISTGIANINLNPQIAFTAVIQAFSGSTCGTNPTTDLVQIGCIRATGISVPTSLALTGLVPGRLYYFRVLGSDTQPSQRSGTFCFCGSTGLSNSSVLPINLNSFTATEQKNIVTVKWSVDINSDAKTFEVERSVNGTTFFPVKTINRTGTDYEIKDIPAIRKIVYYRLKSTTITGAVEYSKILSVNLNGKVVISINPSIVTGSILEIQSSEATRVNIVSVDGKKTANYFLVAGHNHINISSLAKGIYYMQNTASGEMTKFVITK